MPGGHLLHGGIEAGDAQGGIHGDDAVTAEVQNRAELAVLAAQPRHLLLLAHGGDQRADDGLAAYGIDQWAAGGEASWAEQVHLADRAGGVCQRERGDLASPQVGEDVGARAAVERLGDGVLREHGDQAACGLSGDAPDDDAGLAGLADVRARLLAVAFLFEREHGRPTLDERDGMPQRAAQRFAWPRLLGWIACGPQNRHECGALT